MNEPAAAPATESKAKPGWKPLSKLQRRIVGVLVEKAKTTPDSYPMTLNALVNGCKQKSNRDPVMNVEPHQVDDELERLRAMSAVSEVQGSGRVPKYRHFMYEWLGVDKVELAVMTELLLRGAQTVGELRGRAARMEKIADVAALRPILQSLTEKGLLISLSPPGRGQIVTHTLHKPDELDSIKKKYSDGVDVSLAQPSTTPTITDTVAPNVDVESCVPAESTTSLNPPAPATGSVDGSDIRAEIDQLRAEVDRLRKEVEDIWSSLR